MTQIISQYQVAPFTTPTNGTPADADQVKGNDNTVRTGLNNHDADSGIHFQSSTLANRPAAGTAGRKWYTTDEKRLYYDNGTGWDEINYIPSLGVVTGNIAIQATGGITFNTNSTTRWFIDASSGALGSNAYDIGSGVQPVGNIYGASFNVSATKVVGARQTGWTAASGTATRSTFATGSVTTAQLAEHVKALIDDLIAHGLIGA